MNVFVFSPEAPEKLLLAESLQSVDPPQRAAYHLSKHVRSSAEPSATSTPYSGSSGSLYHDVQLTSASWLRKSAGAHAYPTAPIASDDTSATMAATSARRLTSSARPIGLESANASPELRAACGPANNDPEHQRRGTDFGNQSRHTRNRLRKPDEPPQPEARRSYPNDESSPPLGPSE